MNPFMFMQVVLTCFKSMTWVIENKNSTPGSKVAVINLKVNIFVNGLYK